MEKKPVILCADDELINLKRLELMLSEKGYELRFSQSGQEALDQVKASLPDIVLLDIIMPGLSGYEVLLKLRADKDSQRLPVIMLTANRESDYRIKGIEAGCDDFIFKPFDKGEVLARIKTILKVKAYSDHMRNHRDELEKEVEKKTVEIKQASLETIYRLSKAAEFRDEDTGQHIKRMSNYAVVIAQKIGLKTGDIENILSAAYTDTSI